MEALIMITSLVFLTLQVAAERKCNDCINYDKCPESKLVIDKKMIHTNEAIKQLLKNEFCGHNVETGIPMICCSSFQENLISIHTNLELLPTRCGDIQDSRIVNGKKAELYEFPWMALISYKTATGHKFQCGGSIINERYILTAAHCVEKPIAYVRVGEYDIENPKDCHSNVCETYIKDIPVQKVHVHEQYTGMPTLINDIALLRLAEPIDFKHKNVYAICLPTTNQLRNETLDRKIATVAGWGATENGTASSILLKVSVPIYSADKCRNLYWSYTKNGEQGATTNQFCAGISNKGTCCGDSGGPLMLQEKYNKVYRYIQYGVISHAFGECGTYPELFTDLRKFMGWILNNIAP